MRRKRNLTGHPSPDTLLLALDGELRASQARRVNEHLLGCWECRARRDELQAGIAGFMAYRRNRMSSDFDVPSRGWGTFAERLTAVSRKSVASPLVLPILRWLLRTDAFGRPSLLRPAAAALIPVLVVAYAIWSAMPQAPAISAAEALLRGQTFERQVLSQPDTVVHRTLTLEERRPADRVVVARRRIEVWHRGGGGLMARRVYDEADRLIAGEWVGANGAGVIYRAGAQPVEVKERQAAFTIDADASLGTLDTLWRAELSADAFARAVGAADLAVHEDRDTVRLTYRRPERASANGLLQATLTLRKSDWRTTEQQLLFEERSAHHEFRFAETDFEQLQAREVDAERFVPEHELVAAAPLPDATPNAAVSSPLTAGARLRNRIDFANLEMDAWYELHRLGGCVDDWGDVVQRDTGQLHLRLTVKNEACREAATRRLGFLTGPEKLAIDVSIDDAAGAPPPDPGEETAMLSGLFGATPGCGNPSDPSFAALSNAASGPPTQSETSGVAGTAARQLAAWARRCSNDAMSHVQAMGRLIERWSVDDLRAMDADAVAKWQSMVRDRAWAAHRDFQALRTRLQPLFLPGIVAQHDPDQGETRDIKEVADVPAAVQRLLMLATAQRELLLAAFPSPEGTAGEAADLSALVVTLRRAEVVSAGFTSPWQLAH